jgi:hypothetical protein
VESEAEEFMQVGQRLEGFKQVLKRVKEDVNTFQINQKAESAMQLQVLHFLDTEYQELREMVEEKQRLEKLVKLQECY